MIPKEEFEKMEFDSHGFIEPNDERILYRLPRGYKFQNADNTEIRIAIVEILNEIKDQRGSTITKLLTDDCDIPMATYKQYISGKGKVTRRFIAKICIGLKLSLEKANELFKMHSGELNMTNDVDALIYNAILTKDSIYEFEEELKERLNIEI